MADTGRFQELSPTKIQEILDNAVPEKTKTATNFRMNVSVNFIQKQATIVTFTVDVLIILQLRNNEKNAHLIIYRMAVKSCWHKIFQTNRRRVERKVP